MPIFHPGTTFLATDDMVQVMHGVYAEYAKFDTFCWLWHIAIYGNPD